MTPEHTRLLEILRSSGGAPIGVDALRAGVAMPFQVVYELQLAGHDIQRVYGPSGPQGRALLGYRLNGHAGGLSDDR
jgi:hypothetical protein